MSHQVDIVGKIGTMMGQGNNEHVACEELIQLC